MRSAIIFTLILTGTYGWYMEPALPELRRLYNIAATDKDSTQKLIAILSVVDKQSPPVLICYKGAAQMMEAKYAFGPYGKLQKFNAGKSLIEYAVKLDTANIEARYLRFTIQSNIPAFLGYNANEASDRKFLVNSFNMIGDKQLKDMVSGFLISSGVCTSSELKKIKN